MWQHHYVIHKMRMEELCAEAEREQRWHLADVENSRRAATPVPGQARVLAARGIAAVSRAAGRVARRLDARVALELGPDRLVRDA
jgi:hypothetical protein